MPTRTTSWIHESWLVAIHEPDSPAVRLGQVAKATADAEPGSPARRVAELVSSEPSLLDDDLAAAILAAFQPHRGDLATLESGDPEQLTAFLREHRGAYVVTEFRGEPVEGQLESHSFWDFLTPEERCVMTNALEESYLNEVVPDFLREADTDALRVLVPHFATIVADMIEREMIEIRDAGDGGWDDASPMTEAEIQATLADPAVWLETDGEPTRRVLLRALTD
ncbi:hypothetical protein AB0H43_29030 [Hamadaea sp. NPDC050747]|uniref:hypothetical protein n=1 Tax=Hamadaea sp. NPDC050747 TaxID=3155789 RepID=UPI0033D9A8BC